MKFNETELRGAYIVDAERREDERGFFARTYCRKEFEEIGLDPEIVQCNLAFNRRKGTLRGMHWQDEPAAETKLVKCTLGAIWDVIIDLRPDSPTYGQHVGVELSAENRRALYIPKGFAHGYQTLTDAAELAYQVSAFYAPSCERGLRYDDPAFAISWPVEVTVISEKDRSWPLWRPAEATSLEKAQGEAAP